MTNFLLESEVTSEQGENLEIVKVSAESLLYIVNDLLDLGKLQKNVFKL